MAEQLRGGGEARRVEFLAGKDQHGKVGETLIKVRAGFRVERLAKIDTGDLGADHVGKRPNFHGDVSGSDWSGASLAAYARREKP